jgi:hypothetical protein
LKEEFMLSKLLAGLVASMAVAFAGFAYVHHDGSGCCGSKLHVEAVSSDSCCEAAAPSCCQAAATTVAADCCADKCPSEKAATTAVGDCCADKCPSEKAATAVVSEKATPGDHK